MILLESLDALYQQLRGSRCANSVLEVRSLIEDGKFSESIDQLRKIREQYESSRKSTLSQDADQEEDDSPEARRLRRRQGKAMDALGRFSEVLGMLSMEQRRVTASQLAAPAAPPPAATNTSISPVSPPVRQSSSTPSTPTSDEDRLRDALKNVASEDEFRSVLEQQFSLTTIATDHELQSGQRFAVFSNGTGMLVELDQPPIEADQVRMVVWTTRKRLLPVPLDKFHKSASKQRILYVQPKPSVSEPVIVPDSSENASTATPLRAQPKTQPATPSKPDGESPIVSETALRDQVLDMGAFTQLLDAAQRSGIVPGAGVIVQVRDGEYRLGKYHKALQMIESLFASFMAAEMQRTQRLQREDIEISTGRKKLSQRELATKRVQDNQGTQAIERAKVRFQRVLEGLRGLLYLENTHQLDNSAPQ